MAIEELVQSSSAIFTWMEVQRQRFIPKPKAVALDRLLDDASNHFYRESPHYKVKIICNAPTDLVANTSNEALCIVLHQLLRNAAVQKKEGVILLEAWRQKHNTCIAVSDQGKGMSDRVAQNVQEHLDGNLNTPVLYRYGYRIIIRVLQLMNGSITFEKPASGGAKITITIPDM
jgi:K+-sensing histidine kinase KdpD